MKSSKEEALQRRRETDRARSASETVEQRQERLKKRREADRRRRQAEKREVRLKRQRRVPKMRVSILILPCSDSPPG